MAKVVNVLDKFVAAVRRLHSPAMDPARIPETFNKIGVCQRPDALAHIKALHMEVVHSVASRVVGVAGYKTHLFEQVYTQYQNRHGTVEEGAGRRLRPQV